MFYTIRHAGTPSLQYPAAIHAMLSTPIISVPLSTWNTWNILLGMPSLRYSTANPSILYILIIPAPLSTPAQSVSSQYDTGRGCRLFRAAVGRKPRPPTMAEHGGRQRTEVAEDGLGSGGSELSVIGRRYFIGKACLEIIVRSLLNNVNTTRKCSTVLKSFSIPRWFSLESHSRIIFGFNV